MKIKNSIKYILIVLSLILVSFLIEVFIFNFKNISLGSKSKGIHIVNNYKTEVLKDKKIISFKLDKLYVNKLKIKYKSKDDVKVNFEYISEDYYNKKEKKTAIDIFDNEVNLQVLNVKNKVGKFNIIVDKKSKIEIDSIYIDNNIKISYYRIIYIISVLSLLGIILNYYRNNGSRQSLYKYFFLCGLIMGAVFIIVQPSATFYSWDDQIHFQNSYELLGNRFEWTIGEYSMIDGNSVGIWSISSIEEQENQIHYLDKSNKSSYSTKSSRFIPYNKIAYIPSSLGYHFCKLVKLPFFICFKIGKFMNLLTYLIIMAYAIKISKYGKRILTVIGLLPTALFLACQYSYDPAVISGVTLGLVSIVNWFGDKEYKVNFKNVLIFIMAMLYACFAKAVYIPLSLLFLFIPSERFENKKQENWIKGFILVICLLVFSTFALPSDIISSNTGDIRGGDTNIAEQFKLVLSHPIGYLKILKDTSFDQFFDKMIGKSAFGNFSYLGVLKDNYYFFLLIVFTFVSLTDINKNKLSKQQKLLTILSIICTILLIWTALYLSFTPVGSIGINGVQSRYFIPLLFPLIVCLQPIKIKAEISEKKYNIFVLSCLIFIFMLTIYENIILQYCI